MKIERYENKNEFRGFGFPNTLVGKEGVREILTSVKELEIEYLDKGLFTDIFCEFSYKGQKFIVSEPYGDNSYYEISCDQPNTKELEELYSLFASTSVPTKKQWLKVIKLLTLVVSVSMIMFLYKKYTNH